MNPLTEESFEVRPAIIDDATGIAQVHVKSWIETYKGLVPDDYLATLSVAEKSKIWKELLSQPAPNSRTFVATLDNQIVGFVSGGEAREKTHGFTGELYAIYLLKEQQGKGIGKALFQTLTDYLKKLGITSMFLWVLRDNKTVAFYKAMGGTRGTSQDDEMGGQFFKEDMYFWDKI